MPQQNRHRARGLQSGPGHVYVLRSTRDLVLKVGATRRLDKRLKELRGVFGLDARYIAFWPVRDMPAAERIAHVACKPWRVHDERYRLAVDWLGEYCVIRAIERAFRRKVT